MKQLLLIFSFGIASSFVNAQVISQPYIGTPTIIPASPSSSNVIKIATHVTTPNQGIVVDQISHTVSSNPKEINIKGCYWHGMLTAIQEYRDTLVIGQLPPGTYTIKQKAFLSSTQQHCSAIDSNEVNITFTVGGLTTGLNKSEKNEVSFCYPNPAKEILYLENNSKYSDAVIYSASGKRLKETKIVTKNEINIEELPTGLYFIRLSNNNRTEIIKFVKVD